MSIEMVRSWWVRSGEGISAWLEVANLGPDGVVRVLGPIRF